MLSNPVVLGVLALIYLVLVGGIVVYAIKAIRQMGQWRRTQARQLPAFDRQLRDQRLAIQSAGLELDRTVQQVAARFSVGTQDVLALVLGRALIRLTGRRYGAGLWAPIVARMAISRTTAVAGQAARGD